MDMQMIELKEQSMGGDNKQQPLRQINEINNEIAQPQPQPQINEVDNEIVQINPPLINNNSKRYKSFPLILWRVLNLCLCSFYFGYTIGYLGSFDFQSIQKIYDISKDNIQLIDGLLQAILMIGGGIGALSAGIIIRYFSRRNSILFVNFFAFIFGLLVLVQNLTLFFVGRFFQGMCVGIFSAIVPVLIKQYTPNELSATFGALHQTFIAFGVFFSFCFQLILVEANGGQAPWRIQHGFTLITIAIQTILLVSVYKEQTPKYLLLNKRQQQCVRFIEEMYKPQFVAIILKQKKDDLNIVQQNAVDQPQANRKLQRGRRIRIFVAIHLAILQQFSGINAITGYGVQIVKKVVPNLSKVIPVILNFEVIIGGLLSSVLLARVGRVAILQFGTFISFISLLLVTTGFILMNSAGYVLIMIGLFIFMFNFGYSLGPVVWLYIPQIVQTQIIPYSTLANWAASTLVILLFPVLSKLFETSWPLFFFFGAWCLASFLFNKKYLVETKQKTQRQIKQQFSRL